MEKKSIVERIMIALNLGEEGKIGHFFEKQRKTLNREITGLNKNIEAAEYNSSTRMDELNEKLEDATAELEAAYLNVTINDVDTNAKQDSFSSTYWHRVDSAEAKVKSIKDSIVKVAENLKDTVDEYKREIDIRKERIEKIA